MYCDWPLLGRCCFCMPLRRGVLTFAYIHIFFSAFMIGMYSYDVNYAETTEWVIYGRASMLPAEACLAFYCLELIFDALLIYGTHKKAVIYLKVFYYYTMVTCVAVLVIQLLSVMNSGRMFFIGAIEMCIFAFASLCIQIYLMTLIWSLIRKLAVSGPHVYGNPLNQIVNGDSKVETNGIYCNTTVVPLPIDV